ncbi:MAG TPA: diacylglycerol kinase family protein [Actinomycetota bacterium]|nr:diacylglycerol kinase family protein [Actinomycetota bacterium]
MNPEARGVTPALQSLMTTALEARFALTVTGTHARDAGIEVARQAVNDGAELLIAFGGDGLVNEVVNGMAGSDAVLAIIPGGTMNVFARTLGIPANPADAAAYILKRAGDIAPRRLTIGIANSRYFTFAAGCGFDAEAAARVESHGGTKQRFGEPYFFAAALATFAATYATRRPFLNCSGSFGTQQAVLAVGSIGETYAYLAGRPLRLGPPRPPGKRGLDLFLVHRLQYVHLPRYAFGALTGRFGSGSETYADLDEFVVTGEGPVAYHVDGETLEPAARIHVRRAPHRINVLA